jgi:hypothetical protein
MIALYAPTVTLHAAALLGVLFVVLSLMVVFSRTVSKVNLGTGETPAAASAEPVATPLFIAVRSHANFAEYVPFTLLLIGLIEMRTGGTLTVQLLAGGLVLARAIHPIGMGMKAPNPFRAGGFLLTIAVLATASVKALLTVMR